MFNLVVDMTAGLERLERGRVNIGSSVAQQAGSKDVNVAACLTDWQVPAIATELLGDANAELFEALFAYKGVVDSFCRVPGTNRTDIKISDQADGQTADINSFGIDITPVDFGALCDHIDASVDIVGVTLCGSLTGGLPPNTYMRLLVRLNRRGVPTLVDTSGAPPAQVLAAPRDELPAAIKPDRHGLELWVGTSLPMLAETVDTARAVHARGVAQVIVSFGEEGTLLVTAGDTWRTSPSPVRAASTVGVDNAIVAGVLAGWHVGVDTEETVRLSVAFATCKLQRLGPHLPAPGEVRERAAVVQIRRVA